MATAADTPTAAVAPTTDRVLVAWDSARLEERDLPKTADFLQSALGLRGPPWMLGRLGPGLGELFSVAAADAAAASARFHAFDGMRFARDDPPAAV